jgi:hypothetical protein
MIKGKALAFGRLPRHPVVWRLRSLSVYSIVLLGWIVVERVASACQADANLLMSAPGTYRPLSAGSWVGGQSAIKIVLNRPETAVVPPAIARARTAFQQDVNYQK